MSTFSARPADINKKWVVIDAEGLVVGRLASHIAMRLRGKHQPTFTPHMDTGDNVIVINAEKVVFTGNKYEDKEYQSNMGWAKFVEGTGWFGDPVKKEKQKAKFETKFGIPFKDKDQLIGKDIMVEVDTAFGKPYADIKAFPKKKK